MRHMVSRRDFLMKTVVGGVSAYGALARPAWAGPIGANDAVRVAVVGVRSKGNHHIEMFKEVPGVRLVALCDVDETILDQRAAELAADGIQVATDVDVRRLLERKDVDAISIATPNHWHSLMAVWACQAGKDVYVEKPVSHNVWEGRKVVEAAAKYNRIVQAGTQSRSDEALIELAAYLRSGQLGKILRARGFCYKRRESIGKVDGPQPIPAGVDYDLWCGPAPLEPLRRKQLHYDWHWVWDTGNGDIGNQGIHEMDMCRWMLGEETLPRRVFSIGGRFGYVDDAETPNTQIAVFDYPSAPIIFEVARASAEGGRQLHGSVPRRAHRHRHRVRARLLRGRRRRRRDLRLGRQADQRASELRRRRAHGELHRGGPQPEAAGSAGRPSPGATAPRRCATWRTSRIAWGRRCPRPS